MYFAADGKHIAMDIIWRHKGDIIWYGDITQVHLPDWEKEQGVYYEARIITSLEQMFLFFYLPSFTFQNLCQCRNML